MEMFPGITSPVIDTPANFPVSIAYAQGEESALCAKQKRVMQSHHLFT
jgi:hypothetical protein